MPLSLNEIRSRAFEFSKEWAEETSEDAEAKTFWDQFFTVFGVTRRRVASFEVPVKKEDGHGGFIDLLWRGVVVVEHKSRGKDLARAFHQATEYFPGLKERDLPRYILVSDFARFRLFDLDEGTEDEFPLEALHKNIHRFGFISGYQVRSFGKEDPVNIHAAERLGALHDRMKASGFEGHPLEVLLVRLLFCMFAEDTGLFERRQFQDFMEQRTGEDGADLGPRLAEIFQVLNTPLDRRQKTLDEQLASLPHVNGKLFEESLPLAAFDATMRDQLLECCALDWSRISPAIFGSLFQSIMARQERRQAGAHYTTETNILKALHPLFLDELHAEFDKARRSKPKLDALRERLSKIRILDPACGCGNFLVIAYRELRLLELKILLLQHKDTATRFLDVSHLVNVNVDQFHGIELEDWPAQIAQVALWLTDHQMNLRVSQELGQSFARLPLTASPHIVQGNALRLDWATVAPNADYIVGNPPFIGSNFQSDEQKADMAILFEGVNGSRQLDYVCAWYLKAAIILKTTQIQCAFVSTNSITQGEQVGVLWGELLRLGVKINFAHRTFRWSSEARGKAAVHCVIIGFSNHDAPNKAIFDYETPESDPRKIQVSHINPYLVDGADVLLPVRTKPISAVPEMGNGSKPTDGGNLILTTEEKNELVRMEPGAKKWIKPFVGAEEFINGNWRWCLWLKNISPQELKKLPLVMDRVKAVREMRKASKDAATNKFAEMPTLFQGERQPDSNYLIVPQVSSEQRKYVPIGYMPSNVIVSNLVNIIPDATLYHFGVLTSTMHMAWTRAVCGRLKSDYRYSVGIVYNNFPWPEPTEKKRETIDALAQGVLDARAKFPEATLADLYDPDTMPRALLKAHQALDKAVDAAYGARKFGSEAERVAFLLAQYQALVGGA